MPPAKTTTSSLKFDPRATSSTRNPKSKSHSTVKAEPREVTIPIQNPSVLHPTPPVNNPPILKPKSKAYYTIKPELLEESKPPTQKNPVPRLTPAVVQELLAIWKSDPRVPTVASRRAWAASRGVDLTRVHQWFYRRARAKKARATVSAETYELSLEPCAVLDAKMELVSPSRSPSLPYFYSNVTDDPPSSDDTLVAFGFGADSSPPKDVFYVPPRYITRSPSVMSAPYITSGLVGGHACMRDCAQESPASRSPIPEAIQFHEANARSPVPTLSLSEDRGTSRKYSPAPTLSMHENRITDDTFDSQDSFHRACNQGDPEVSDFTCTLCTPIEDFPQIDIDQLVQQSQSIFPFDASLAVFPSYARPDTTPDTLMELSAIPYMFCTPRPLAVPALFYSSASGIEEELAKVLTDNRFEVSSVSALDLHSELLG